MAADLYLREVDVLRFELSMSNCSEQVWAMAREIQASQHAAEPRDAASQSRAMSAHPVLTEPDQAPAGLLFLFLFCVF